MSTIRKAIQDNDPAQATFEQIRTALDLLDKLASIRLQELSKTVDEMQRDPRKFKILHQERESRSTHVTAEKDVSNLTSALEQIIGGFCAGSTSGTISAVKNILGTALSALLGAGAGQEVYQVSYAAIAEDGILKRLDVAFWSYGISAIGITKESQTAIAYHCVKSIIDPKDVHVTELTSMYSEEARRATTPQARTDILAALEEARKVLKAMQEDPVRAMDRYAENVQRRLSAT